MTGFHVAETLPDVLKLPHDSAFVFNARFFTGVHGKQENVFKEDVTVRSLMCGLLVLYYGKCL